MIDALKDTDIFKLRNTSRYNLPSSTNFGTLRQVILKCLQPRCERANIEEVILLIQHNYSCVIINDHLYIFHIIGLRRPD